MARCTFIVFLMGCLWGALLVPGAGAVVGGQQATNGAWPFAAALIDASMSDTLTGQLCGAVVVAPREVVTAAHCVTPDGSVRPRRKAFDIVAGRLRLRGSAAARVHVAVIRIHPGFDPKTLANDLALLELSRTVTGAARLDDGSADVVGSAAIALGWGSIDATPQGDFPDALRQTALGIEADAACSAAYGDGYLPASMLCAGVPQGGRDTCQGDSGGPLVGSGSAGETIVIGLTSFGGTCGQPGAPGAYVRASIAASWLAAGGTTTLERTATLPQRRTQVSGVRPIARPARSRTRTRA